MQRSHAQAIFLITTILLAACTFGASPTEAPTPGVGSVSPTVINTGATDSAGVGSARVTITFAAHNYERPRYEPLIVAFEEQNPAIRVQVADLDTVIKPVYDSSGLQIIDDTVWAREILSAADTAGFPVSAEAIEKGWLYDLTPLMDADASFDRADFYPGALEAASQNGRIYQVPSEVYVELLSYNKDLWAAHGLPAPKPDWSWNDVFAAAQQLTQKRGETVEVYGLADWNFWPQALENELAIGGARPDPAHPLRLDDPKSIAALERVVALFEAGMIAPPPASQDSPDTSEQLIRDQRAGIWRADLLNRTSAPPGFAIGTMPVPSGGGDVTGYVMSAGTQHPREAWRWLNFLSQHADDLRDPGDLRHLPARKSIAERSGYWKRFDTETAAAINATLARRTPPGGAPLLLPSDVRGSLVVEEAVATVVRGTQTAREALHTAQTVLDQRSAQAAARPTPITEQIVVATPAPEVPPGATAITFGALASDAAQARIVAREFNQRNPGLFVDVKTIRFPPSGSLRLADIAAQTDCFVRASSPDQEQITGTLDLRPLIDADAAFQRDDYPPVLLAPFQRGSALYGLPYTVDVRVLHYNKTAFDASGLAYPSVSWTIDDFLNAAQHLTSGTGDAKQYGFASIGWRAPEVFFFLDRFGAMPATGDVETPQPNFTDPKVGAALRFYVDLLRNDSPHTHLTGYIRDEIQEDAAVQLIEAGRVGMWFEFGRLSAGVSDSAGFVHAVAPPPLGASAVTPNDFRVRGLYISAKTQQPQVCWEWLKYLGSNLAGMQGAFPARRSLAEFDVVTARMLAGADEVRSAYRNALNRPPSISSTSAIQSRLDYYWFFRAIDRALQGKNLSTSSGQALERELADAQSLTEQYLACIRGGAPGRTCATRVDPDYQGFAEP